MALLSTEDQLTYRLAHGKQYIAQCDGPCGLGIPAGDLYVVKSWKPRKDKLTFLGAIPSDVLCMTCADVASGKLKVVDGLVSEPKPTKDKVKLHKRDMIAPVRRGVLKLLTEEKPKHGYTTEELILKLRRRASMREHNKGEIRKTLSLMKKFRDLKRKDGKWFVPKVK